MSDCKSELVNIKFLVKLKKSATETLQLLIEAYGQDCMFRARVWIAQMIFGRQRKRERWWSPRPTTHSCYRWQHWKSAKCDSKRPKVGCSSRSWGSQLGEGKCSMNSMGRNWTWERFVQKWFQNCCQMNKKNVTRNCVWTFCNTLRMNQVCWIR